MAAGDYESLKALYSVSPEMIPKPLGHGTFESDNDLHFLLREFVEMEEMIPDAFDLCQAVGRLHTNSQKLGPTQLGFQVTTCNGTVPQYTQWTSSWEEFFTKKLQSCFELEEYAHGSSSQITELLPDLFEKVCPRLLRPLETNGNNLQPSLIHGDLWDGNISVSANTGRPYIFDPAALWAHNEYDLHTWRGSRFKVAAFTEEYFRQFLPSPPEEDVDDRNLLYSLIADLHDSILFKHTEQFRCLLIQTLRTLVEKFPNGYEGPAARKGSESVNKDG
jgi:fructosamine-3-kinase